MGSQNLRILPFARFQAIRAGSAGHFLPAFGSFSTFSSQPLLLAPASLIWLRSSEWTKGGNFNVLPVRPIAPLSIQLGQPNAGKAFAQMREKLACQSTRSLQLFIDNDLVKEADQSYSVLQCITKQYQAVPSIQGNSQVPDPSIPKQTCHKYSRGGRTYFGNLQDIGRRVSSWTKWWCVAELSAPEVLEHSCLSKGKNKWKRSFLGTKLGLN